ncbi:MAG: Maf family protein [Planctomycetaceae bacterium]|jgi:septum formation protein|nr:Maf family protein [Planctomycetaceae bacterium]
MNHFPLILASQSPRRRQLLIEAGFMFEVSPPDAEVEDVRQSGETPEHYVCRLAVQKANNVAAKFEQGLIIACDTVVLCKNQILEKPTSRNDARQMLRFSRGQIQSVLSGLCLLTKGIREKIREDIPESISEDISETDGTTIVRTDQTTLQMQPITDSEIEDYLDGGLWQGKAGAFGYQDRNHWLSIIDGSESNIVGLPMELLKQLLKKFKGIKNSKFPITLPD